MELDKIAKDTHRSLASLIAQIDQSRGTGNLASALRLFVLKYGRDTNARSDLNGN